jgi:hypothetical protein
MNCINILIFDREFGDTNCGRRQRCFDITTFIFSFFFGGEGGLGIIDSFFSASSSEMTLELLPTVKARNKYPTKKGTKKHIPERIS